MIDNITIMNQISALTHRDKIRIQIADLSIWNLSIEIFVKTGPKYKKIKMTKRSYEKTPSITLN